MPAPDVTICIPAYQAEAFIARTLDCATTQTHDAARILVSVDSSPDATVRICREFAARDSRVEVIEQSERLGWSENANALLDRVETPYFFLYFHDDVIDPDYVATLRARLESSPDAASAHCDIARFGKVTGLQRGEEFEGTASARILAYLAERRKGILLRALMRTDRVGGLRFAAVPGGGKSIALPFTLAVLAAGPSRHVAQPLYHRWMREGSLTRTWNARARDELVSRERGGALECLRVIDAVAGSDTTARDAMTLAVGRTLVIEANREARTLGVAAVTGGEIHSAFADVPIPPAPAMRSDRRLTRLRRRLHR